MITKERLKKLIKNEATIYTWNDKSAFDFNNNMKFEEKVFEIKLRKSDKIVKFFQSYALDSYDHPISALYTGIPLNLLFETKFDMEFGNITKTEKLKLPTWEEFCKMEDDKIFYNQGSTYALRNDVDEIKIIENYYDNISYIFNKPLTKENYIDACRLCKKLFMGE